MNDGLTPELVRRISKLEDRVARLGDLLSTHRHHRDPTWDLWIRNVDRRGRAVYTDHFRSGNIPAGFAWIADGTFNGAPAAIDYNDRGTYLQSRADNTPHFLADAITTYDDKALHARVTIGQTAELGIRIDDGSDNNYAQIILDPDNLGSYTVNFRFRAGGGAITDNAGPTHLCGEFVIIRLVWASATPLINGRIIGEHGRGVTISGFTTGALAWTPSRIGFVYYINNGDYTYADWFYSDFS